MPVDSQPGAAGEDCELARPSRRSRQEDHKKTHEYIGFDAARAYSVQIYFRR
jgi:hypothetical protein